MLYNNQLNAVFLGWAITLASMVFNGYLFATGVRVGALGLAFGVLTLASSYFFESLRDTAKSSVLLSLYFATTMFCAAAHAVWFTAVFL